MQFTDIQKAIINNVRRNSRPTRDSIISEVSWDGNGWSRKDIQQAFTQLRQEGHIYRVSDGWYQTDIKL